MIQRIQSLYLLIVGALAIVATLMPLLYFSTTTGELFDLYASGLCTADGVPLQGSIYMLILSIASSALPIGTIFLYNNRMLQVRLCAIECVLLIGNYAMIGAYFFLSCRAFEEIGIASKGFHPALFAPLAAIVFCYLAGRAIFGDELLVRSVDRIR
ncbi:MAG: DUF4293 domain-containing protein [Rikenellaceae bacterium]